MDNWFNFFIYKKAVGCQECVSVRMFVYSINSSEMADHTELKF